MRSLTTDFLSTSLPFSMAAQLVVDLAMNHIQNFVILWKLVQTGLQTDKHTIHGYMRMSSRRTAPVGFRGTIRSALQSISQDILGPWCCQIRRLPGSFDCIKSSDSKFVISMAR